MLIHRRIFISHSWDHSEYYLELVELLNGIRDLKWDNLSISRNDAIEIAIGPEAKPQRQRFLFERLGEIAIRSNEIRLAIERLFKSLEETIAAADEIQRYLNLNNQLAEIHSNIMQPNFAAKIRQLDRLRNKYEEKDIFAEQNKIAKRISAIEADIDKLNQENQRLVREANSSQAAPDDINAIILGKTGKNRDNVTMLFPNLAIALRNRIAASDIVLLIALPDMAFHCWMEFEYQEAFIRRKPVLALLHQRLTSILPADLRRYSIEPIAWDQISVESALKVTAGKR